MFLFMITDESKTLIANFVKPEKEEHDEEIVDDPTWDKENDRDEDETFDEWGPSSDDDWEPVSEKKRIRRETSLQTTRVY